MTEIVTHIATSNADSVTVRGRDLVSDLMGKHGFTEVFYFLICGRMPTRTEHRVLDLCLVTLMEHGFTPASVITRLTQDAVPGEMQVAIASGLLAVGSVFAGTMEGCSTLLREGIDAADPEAYCRDVVDAHKKAKRPVPGFGHAFHKPDDPRTPRLFAVAREAGIEGRYITLLETLGRAVDEAAGKHITINATGAIGALLLEIGIPSEASRGVAVVSRSAGLVGHVLEEQQTHSARAMTKAIKQAIPYREPNLGQ